MPLKAGQRRVSDDAIARYAKRTRKATGLSGKALKNKIGGQLSVIAANRRKRGSSKASGLARMADRYMSSVQKVQLQTHSKTKGANLRRSRPGWRKAAAAEIRNNRRINRRSKFGVRSGAKSGNSYY